MALETGEVKKEEAMASLSEMTQLFALFKEQKEKIEQLEKQLAVGGNGAGNIVDIISQVIKGIKQGDKEGITIRGGIQLDQIPEGDHDEKGVVFCAPNAGYVITDYFKMGHRILPPYGINSIFFEHKASRRKRDGKEHQIFHTSMYVSHSNELTEWLRQHPFYNIFFYESQKSMTGIDVKKAVRTANLMNMVKDWDGMKILRACTDLGIPKHDDIDVMRSHVVTVTLEKQEKKEALDAEKLANETHKASLLFKDSGSIE